MTSIAALIDSTPRAKRLRELIIDKSPSIILSKLPLEFSNIIRKPKAQAIVKRLNKIQQRAVFNSIIAIDYLLIKGMPGTGTAFCIVSAIYIKKIILF